jgi:hypothetical protein
MRRSCGVPVFLSRRRSPAALRCSTRTRLLMHKQTNEFASRGSRAQSIPDLRRELSSLTRTLGLWVRIPLEAWISVCVYSAFVLDSGLATGWSLVRGVLPNVLD